MAECSTIKLPSTPEKLKTPNINIKQILLYKYINIFPYDTLVTGINLFVLNCIHFNNLSFFNVLSMNK